MSSPPKHASHAQDEHQDTRSESRIARVLIVARRSQKGGDAHGLRGFGLAISGIHALLLPPPPLYTYLSIDSAIAYTSHAPHALCTSMAHAAVRIIS